LTSRIVFGRGRGHSWQLIGGVSCAVVLAAFLIRSTSVPPPSSSATGHAGQLAAAGVTHSRHGTAAAVRPWSAAAAQTRSAADLSLRLEALLGQHAVLSADMMRGRLRGDPDFAQAANAALGKNTDDMGELVGSLFGEQAQTKFTTLWATHVSALFNYARGLDAGDESVREEARKSLASYESNLAGFFADASDGRLKRGAVEGALRSHVEQLLDQADAYAGRRYARADVLYREAYTHTFGLGKTLATGLLSPGTANTLEEPEWRLRSELGRLLGEHAALVVTAMRSGVADTGDFRAAAEAVNGKAQSHRRHRHLIRGGGR